MSNVNVSTNVSFNVRDEEKEILQKAHDILRDTRYQWNVKDDNAWDDERYWELDGAVNVLVNLFGCNN